MIKKLNNYFICDPDEQPSFTDYIGFYGITIMVFLIAVFSLIGIIKG